MFIGLGNSGRSRDDDEEAQRKRGPMSRGVLEGRIDGMSQYLLTVPHDSDEEPTMETMDPAELEAAMAATGAIIEELTSIGAFVFAGGLMPPSSAITVDNTGESLSTVNGPFVEAPEYLGGFWVIDVADEEAAVGWAARASKALGGRIEVRAFQVPPGE